MQKLCQISLISLGKSNNCDIYYYRRDYVKNLVKKHNGSLLMLTNYPLLGCKNHIYGINMEEYPLPPERNPISESLFTLDESISPAPKYRALMNNIKSRRGHKPTCLLPLYMDKKTSVEPTNIEPYPGKVYLDASLLSFGGCTIQYTYEGASLNHAKYLHDQMHALSPILVALSAGCSIFKGRLLDIDTKTYIVGPALLDDRKDSERIQGNDDYIPYSRYDIGHRYISDHIYVKEHFLDSEPYPINLDILSQLISAGMTPRFAKYYASLFVHDPPGLTQEALNFDIDDSTKYTHFFNFRQSNWPDVRFKAPLVDGEGWRAENRSMEIQLTNFENGSLGVFLGLIVKLLTEFDVNFLLPLSQVSENWDRAKNRDAVIEEKFYFRKDIIPKSYKSNLLSSSDYLVSNSEKEADLQIEELTVEQILEGDANINYKGIIPLMEEFMEFKGYAEDDVNKLREHLKIIRGRASRQYKTPARFTRDFVLAHTDYKHDSVVSEQIARDLLLTLIDIDQGDDYHAMKF